MDLVFSGIISIFSPMTFIFCFLGVFLGSIVGAIPGLTGSMLIALSLPLTYYMDPSIAMVLLISMYVGSVSGSMLSATLLRMPGTPASMMTTLDAYPMAAKGKAGRALGLGISSSFSGGMISWIFLALLTRPMADIAVKFGPFEYFSLVMMAFVLIATISRGSMALGATSCFLGIAASFPGVDVSTGNLRMTFGFHELDAGFAMLPVLIGIFAFNQIIKDSNSVLENVEKIDEKLNGVFLKLKDWKKHSFNLLRSSLIGTWIGILPGVGANVGSIVSYSVARKASKTPETFGTGEEAGIVASEAGNNATINGALIPLLALGIPGSVNGAILLGALTLHGMLPGPLLYINRPDVVSKIIGAALVANFVMYFLLSLSSKYIAKIASIEKKYLLPVVTVFCIVGCYSVANRWFDVWTMVAFGIVGFLMERCKLPLEPFIIGFVLGPIAEKYLRSGLMISRGSLLPLLTRPLSLIFVLGSLIILFWPSIKKIIK
jgi:putative tricarboxylic transport membrane protein